MPDILGPVLYLSMYLLVFGRESLSRAERLTLVLIAWWAVASHITHLMLAGGFCVLLLPLLAFRRSMRRWSGGIAEVATIVLIAAAAHLALHSYLYGELSLSWRHRKPRVVGLTAVIVFMVIVNAFVTGVLSTVEDRYQSRVIWLVPLLAGLFVLEWLDHRTRRDCKREPRPQESVCTNLSDV